MMVFMLMTRFGFCCCSGHVFNKPMVHGEPVSVELWMHATPQFP